MYYARVRVRGRLVRRRLSTNREVSIRMLNELRVRADRGEFGILDNDYPWTDLKTEFLQWAEQSVRGHKQYKADLKKFEEFAKIKGIREITHKLVYGFRRWRKAERVSPRTINRQVGTVQNMLNKAVEWQIIGSNPIKDVKPLAHDVPKKSRRSLTVAEVGAILKASPSYLRSVWRVLMTTGLRRGELVNLTFSDVDLDRKVAIIRAEVAKNHKLREVPLDDIAVAEIAALKEQAEHRQPVAGKTSALTRRQLAKFSKQHVFVTRANTPLKNHLLKRFYAVCRRAGITDAKPNGSVDLHSLRVTFITLAIEHGASPKAIQDIVGHSTLAMTMNVYAKTTDRSKRQAIGVLPFAQIAPENVAVEKAHKLSTIGLLEPETKIA